MKIRIIGCSGSGKTYLAKRLSKKYNIPNFDLDDIQWDRSGHGGKSECGLERIVCQSVIFVGERENGNGLRYGDADIGRRAHGNGAVSKSVRRADQDNRYITRKRICYGGMYGGLCQKNNGFYFLFFP